MKITKAIMQQFIGKNVKVTLYDGDILNGTLKLGDIDIWWQKNKYHIDNWWFRVSCIKKVEMK